MKRKYMTLAIISTLFLLLSILNIHVEAKIPHNTEEEQEINKNQNYELYDIIVSKNQNADFKNIQDAIDDSAIGSKIYVKSGTYNEIISINKKLNLIGENKENTIINPTSKKNSYSIRITKPNVIISGFTVENKGPGLYATGIKISAPETSIKECNFYNTPIGIAVWTSNNKISNCKFSNCEDEGIALLGSIHNKCDNNIISNCEFDNNCDGIELQYSSKNIISDCIFYHNTHCGIDAIGSNNNENQIINCQLYDNKAYGIYLSRSSNNKIKDCLLSNNEDGNIIMTPDSLNNEIINQESHEESEEKLFKNLHNRIYYFIENIRASKIRFLNFFENLF